MATTLFFRSESSTTHRGTNTAKLDGNTSGWIPQALATTRGSGTAAPSTATVAGTTNGVELASSGTPLEFLSDPVSADVTISGTITANIWASENNMSANVAINVIIDILRANSFGSDGSNEIVNIVKSTRVTEVAVTTNAVNNFTTGMTSGAYTGQTLNKGDRLRIRIFGGDAGTMGSGFTFTAGYSGSTASANGDSFVTFSETFSFMSLSTPGGTILYLRDTASDVVTSAVDRALSTTQGSTSSVTDVTNTQNGWVNPIQVTDTAGGTIVDWFSTQLQAFTLTGLAQVNLRLLESNAAAQASARCELARVDSDGTNATVWASWCVATTAGQFELSTSNAAWTIWESGDDLSFTDGQRIRLRVYVDDQPLVAMVTGHTVTLGYDDGTGTNGDSFVALTQSVSEFTPAVSVVTRDPWPALDAVRQAASW